MLHPVCCLQLCTVCVAEPRPHQTDREEVDSDATWSLCFYSPELTTAKYYKDKQMEAEDRIIFPWVYTLFVCLLSENPACYAFLIKILVLNDIRSPYPVGCKMRSSGRFLGFAFWLSELRYHFYLSLFLPYVCLLLLSTCVCRSISADPASRLLHHPTGALTPHKGSDTSQLHSTALCMGRQPQETDQKGLHCQLSFYFCPLACGHIRNISAGVELQ